MRARDKRTATETSGADVLSSKKNQKNLRGAQLTTPPPLIRPRVKNPKSPNGTETNQLTIYKRGRGFSRVIQI